jgi:hypothetical protein
LNIKNRQQLLLIIALAALGLFAADKLLITPLQASWKARSARIADLTKKVTEGRALISRAETLRTRWEGMQTNTLPVDLSQAEQKLLKGVDTWAQESRISVTSINPQWKRAENDFRIVQCRVEATGSLNAVTRFLFNLEEDPMAVRIENLELSARDAEGQQLAVGLQLSGLVLLPEVKR